MPLDINLSPLFRMQGQEPDMPGILAMHPPQNAARGREQDRLIVYLALTGNAAITTTEYRQFTEDVAATFYRTPRAITSALRASADWLNRILLERNMKTSGVGQYTIGWLSLAVLRENQCTFSLNGPMHAYGFTQNGSRHYFEPSISGKGLGSSQAINIHYAQSDFTANDMLLFCARVPGAWATPLQDAQPSSFDAMRRRLTTLTTEDLNALLIQGVAGTGAFRIYKAGMLEEKVEAPVVEEEPQTPQPEEAEVDLAPQVQPAPPASEPTEDLPGEPKPEPTPEAGAHLVQPSAFPTSTKPASDPLASLPRSGNTVPRDFPASIPRAQPHLPTEPKVENQPIEESTEPMDEAPEEEKPILVETNLQTPPAPIEVPSEPKEPSRQAKQAAKTIINLMHGFRTGSTSLGERLRSFLPHLLPAENRDAPPVSASAFMGFMAVLIPLIVVTLSVVVYLRYGRNEQYDIYYNQAVQIEQQVQTLTNPVEQRIAWENVLANLDRAEEHRQTSETITLRREADANRDQLLGIYRMQFIPAFSSRLGIEISRMAARENDIYLLNAANGEVLRAIPSGSGGFELDTTFDCRPGSNNPAGPLVDILILPITNIYGATVLGIDAVGNLLYCKPGGTPQVGLLSPPDTNWNRVTSFALDAGNLYVLDAQSRAVWVYLGKEAAFLDRPYFFFSQQTPTQDVIDFVISGDEMHLLHADGRVSSCIYSRANPSASECKDPVNKTNPYPAYEGIDLFGTAHFTQITFAAPPDPSILLLDAENQSIMRFAAHTLELQNQFQPASETNAPIPRTQVDAISVSPDHVLYIAVDGQVYFALNMP
ncbi:MAG: hypothetical protein H6635_11995 [Anaerolineales bacterium]|nr:hypothetical protein [Anaerolineales bacterium]MCB9146089.1 hypothetical protein [Anaerolineales bacterium]